MTTKAAALERAAKYIVECFPDLWGDHVQNGLLTITIHEDYAFALEAALALPPDPETITTENRAALVGALEQELPGERK